MADEATEEKVNYLMVIQVEATDAADAISKKNEGKILSVDPAPKKAAVQFGGGVARPSQLGQTIIRNPTKE